MIKMSAKTEKDAVGKAVYLEFRKGNYTYQMVMTPITSTLDGSKVVPASKMVRRISSYHPRRNWNFTSIPTTGDFALGRDVHGNFEFMDELGAKEFAARAIFRLAGSELDSLAHQGWELYKQPIAVEVSYKDIASIASGKTPNELMRRIERSRKSFDFSEALFNAEVA
jgi:hypothetical protein